MDVIIFEYNLSGPLFWLRLCICAHSFFSIHKIVFKPLNNQPTVCCYKMGGKTCEDLNLQPSAVNRQQWLLMLIRKSSDRAQQSRKDKFQRNSTCFGITSSLEPWNNIRTFERRIRKENRLLESNGLELVFNTIFCPNFSLLWFSHLKGFIFRVI